MKRTPLKRGTSQMKRGTLKKKSKQSISKIQKLIWAECRRIVAEQFGKDCYTCGKKNLQGSDCQLGHVPWPKASLGAFLKYDIRVLRFQCYSCNIWKSGLGAEAYKRMLKEEGQMFMDNLERDRQVTVKAYDHYLKLLEEYRKITK